MQKGLFDLWIVAPIVILLTFSLAVLQSLVPQEFPQHGFYIAVALLTFALVSSVDYRLLRIFSPAFYLTSLLLLITTFIFGQVTRGAIRWIEIGPLTIQPSELAKPLMVLSLAYYAERWDLRQTKLLLGYIALLGIPLLLVFKQPDLGSALVLGAVGIMIAIGRGVSLRFLGVLVGGTALLAPVLSKLLAPYQKERLYSFIDPYADPLGSGYSVIQSVIAVGSGQLFGRGLGHGTQSQLRFLPERHSDFIFAALAEELGFVGAAIVLLCYLALLMRLIKIAKSSPDLFGSLITVGVFTMITFQVAVNIGMNLGLIPITGITLPLISSGGSSLFATAVSLGLVQSVARRIKPEVSIEIH